jgi:SecD/SecF fusion protein
MTRRRPHLVILGLIAVALVGVALIAIPGSPLHKGTRLGLDLQGGLEVVLKAVPPRGHQITSADLDRSVSVMRDRVDKIGVAEPEIRKQGSDQIVIELPGVKNAEEAASLIGKTAQLELYDLESSLTGPSVDVNGFPQASTSLYNLLAGQQARAKKGEPTGYYVFLNKKPVGRMVQTEAQAKDVIDQAVADAKEAEAAGKPVPKGATDPASYQVFAVPEGETVVTCSAATSVVCPGVGAPAAGVTYSYLFKYQPDNKKTPIPQMSGADLKLSGTRQDVDPQTGQPIVLLSFTDKGRKIFHAITREEAVRGQLLASRLGLTGNQADNALQHFAIVLDNEIRSFPSIDYRQYPDGIDPINGAQITGIASAQEAKNLALVLQTGALPVEFQQLEQTQVSATLGKDSLRQAEIAAAIGLALVALFLLVFYRFLGVVAVAGLAIYGALLYGVILLLNVTLTLPGFAGIVLTIGVAADANVVVFERIKEEVRSGKSVRAAVSSGYSKGFHTIIDANVVTALTALVLFAVATAGVKGFALMLLIGTAISLFTAVAATRAMLGLLAGFRWFDSPRMFGAAGKQRGTFLQIDFIGRRRLWFAISGVIILVSIVSLATRGLNLGIDFKGGTQVTFNTPQYVSLTKVRDQANAIGRGDAVIQGRGSAQGEAYKAFQIRTKSLKPADQETLRNDLEQRVGAEKIGIKNVSSSFGRQIAKLAILAILVSLALIILYITIRFDLKFAGPVIVAMLHDILITVGVYSLSGNEVSTATVAAVLTVLGYSIYDTIIIFDRIRENIPLMRRASFKTIANVSLWETVRRSLVTTFITLLPVASLYLFGGETLRTFALALLVGIGAGAYSSIFIAAPLLTMWKEREPEWRRRMGSDVVDVGVGGAAVLAAAEAAAAGEPAPETPLMPEIEPEPEPVVVGEEVADGEREPGVAPEPEPALAGDGAASLQSQSAQSKRERRRQRRSTRPHGRAR